MYIYISALLLLFQFSSLYFTNVVSFWIHICKSTFELSPIWKIKYVFDFIYIYKPKFHVLFSTRSSYVAITITEKWSALPAKL